MWYRFLLDRQGKNNQRGFTLMEMMIVVAIISIVSMLGVPNYTSWNARHQLRQASTEIQSQLSFARVSAMSRNSVVSVNVSASSGKVVLSATDASGVSVVQPVALPGGVIGVAPEPAGVTFSPLGIRSGGGTGNQLIVISNNHGLSYSILVTPRGTVRWCPAATCT
ncbi:MAG: GspH/FimT family pseudopilin [Nitrospira sp.]|nr:GspH/FimT family pseudopilin [Nitrospira sp.]